MTSRKTDNNKKLASAIFPGSFDPFTIGHEDILKRASETFEVVYLALMINPEKSYFFDVETRLAIAEGAAKKYPNVKVIYDESMLFSLAQRLCCSAIVKGVRNAEDLDYEIKMARYNKEHGGIETLLLPCLDEELGKISSTYVRSLLKANELEKAASLMPCEAAKIIVQRGFK